MQPWFGGCWPGGVAAAYAVCGNVADGMAFDVPNVAKKSFFRSFCN